MSTAADGVKLGEALRESGSRLALMSPGLLDLEIAALLREALAGIVEDGGAHLEELDQYALDLARRATRAAAAGRADLVEMVLHQAQALAEGHRIRLRRVTWEAVANVIEAVVRAVFLGLVGAKR